MQNVEPIEPQDVNAQVSEAMDEESQGSIEQRPSSKEQDRNWHALRSKADEAERRSQQLEQQLSEYASIVKDLATDKKKESEPEEEFDESDIPTFGQTKKTIKREAEKIAREIVKQTMVERDQLSAPNRLKQEHADFDSVVTRDNVDYLIKNEPEIAAILRDTTDQYKQGKVAYKFIKSLGLSKKDSTEVMRQDASDNTTKPVSPNSIGGRSSVGDANMFAKGLTSDLKKQLHQEMIDAIRGR